MSKKKNKARPSHHNALQCLECNVIVMSLRTHDMVFCDCKAVAVDGGFDYFKATATFPDKIKSVKIKIV